MTITSEKLRHWSQMASLTSEGVSCLSAEQLAQIAEHIDAQAARIDELECGFNDEALAQEERAENAEQRVSELESELAALREQKPVGETVNVGGAILVEWERCLSEGTELFTRPVPTAPVAVPVADKLHEIVSAVRSLNRAKHHIAKGVDDDEPCYWQRKEWIDWMLELCNEADEVLRLNSGSKPADAPDDLVMQIRRLVHALKNAKPDHSLVKSVPDYMRRKGYWKVTDCLRDGGSMIDE